MNETHAADYRASIEDPAAYFDKEAKKLHWFKPYTKILDTSDKYLHRWFPDGEINLAYNCLDRHVEAGDGHVIAYYEDSAYTGQKR